MTESRDEADAREEAEAESVETPLGITEAGVYEMTNEAYQADPVKGGSLSRTGARTLLPPGCPALYKYQREHGRPPKAEFDLGHAAHHYALGVGEPLTIVAAADWRTNAAKAVRDEARAAGRVPILAAQHEQVLEMAAALREHPLALALFSNGEPEKTLIWQDERTGVWLRARPDWLPYPDEPYEPSDDVPMRRMVIPDYKTCEHADLDSIQRAIPQHGYHIQAAWIMDAVRALGIDEDPAFVFVFQEKTPPYLVNVATPDVISVKVGRMLSRRGIDKYAECVRDDHWPGYSEGVEVVSLPPWIENRYLLEMS